tara:strand:- start:213 stop:611 length:399 start_codon:yes stop_codon:yes gene_type:complete
MTEISNIILDLEIVKLIKENDKLGLIITDSSKKLFVDRYYTISSITRWFNGYNRENTIQYLEDLVLKIKNINKFLLEGKHLNTGKLLQTSIESALPGLNYLKNTYNSDSLISAKLTIIINKLNQEYELLNNM